MAIGKPQPGERVLDAATGTGLAAFAAARAVGESGKVIGVDISSGMLREAKAALAHSDVSNIEFVKGDAALLSAYDEGTFDMVLCAAGLLYMPAAEALREWRRVLKRGGRVALTTMGAGSPPSARVFRECAAAYGVPLQDASAPLGSVEACRALLTEAGFAVITVSCESLAFIGQDWAMAWESNFKSAAHAAVQQLSSEQQAALKEDYLRALGEMERTDPDALHFADVLFAVGRKEERAERQAPVKG